MIKLLDIIVFLLLAFIGYKAQGWIWQGDDGGKRKLSKVILYITTLLLGIVFVVAYYLWRSGYDLNKFLGQ